MLFNGKDNTYRIFDHLISLGNLSFAIYHTPGDNSNLTLVLQMIGSPHSSLDNFDNIDKLNGFIISPFHAGASTPIILINPDVEREGEDNILAYLQQQFGKDQAITYKKPKDKKDTYSIYSEAFAQFMQGFEDNKFDKIVLSRTLEQSKTNNFSTGISFRNALNAYPNSFVFLCHTPLTGTWLGSTPEMILTAQGNEWHTVALAGTKHISEKETEWDNKNRIEQDIVVNFVEEQLNAIGCNYTKSQPNIIEAGNVVHLKSDFKFSLPHAHDFGKLITLLHPTPAVCGYPKQAALQHILKHEGYDRKYYSGFVGRVSTEHDTELYVNLRCMEIEEEKLTLYAGGGLLPSSKLETEWKETENKLQTMLSIIHQ